ncbi:hypothetical protein Dimus_029174 [Dionaea muscipula]
MSVSRVVAARSGVAQVFLGCAFWCEGDDSSDLVQGWRSSARMDLRARGCSSSPLLVCLLLAVAIAVVVECLACELLLDHSVVHGFGGLSFWVVELSDLAAGPAVVADRQGLLVLLCLLEEVDMLVVDWLILVCLTADGW